MVLPWGLLLKLQPLARSRTESLKIGETSAIK